MPPATLPIPAGYTEEPLNGAGPQPVAAPPQQAMPTSTLDGYTEEPLPGVQQPATPVQQDTPPPAKQHYIRDALRGLTDLAGQADFQVKQGQAGALKSGATTLSHILNMVRADYKGDVFDIPAYMKEHPGSTPKDAWMAIRGKTPDGRDTEPYRTAETEKQRHHLREAADWLAQRAKLPEMNQPGGFAQHVGAVGGELAQWFGTEGLLGLGVKAGEAPAAVAEGLSAAQKLKRAASVADIMEQYPMLGKVAAIGTRVMHLAEAGAPITEQAIVGGTTSAIQSEGDPRETFKGALIAGGMTAAAREASSWASQYLKKLDMPSAAKAAEEALGPTTGEVPPPKFTPLPEKPVKPEFTPTEVGAAPQAPEKIDPLQHPPAPVRPEPIPRPAPPEATPIPEQPVMAAGPEPTPLPAEPEYPGLYDAGRAPVEQRVADMEKQLAQGVVGEGETIGSQHLENLNDSISHADFVKMKPSEQAEIVRQRRSLQHWIARGMPPPDTAHVVDEVGDFSQAAEMMRQPAAQARARWNELSGGQFETLQSQIDKLEGKVDQVSVAKRGDLEREMAKLVGDAKFQGTATPVRRALYRSMMQDADVLDEAGTVIDGSFKGAARTGEFNPSTFQSGWKSFVNKHGVERVKGVLGEERFNSMNDFVNKIVEEGSTDKAYQAAQDALYKSAMEGHATQVSEIKAADKAAMDAHESAFDETMAKWKEQKAQIEEGDKTAKADQTAKWQQDRIAQAQEFKKTKAEYDAGVAEREAERKKLIADRGKEYNRQRDEWKQAKEDAKNLNAEERKKIDDEHKKNLDAWQAETDKIKSANVLEKNSYKLMKQSRAALDAKTDVRAKSFISQIKTGNRALDTVLALSAAATPVEILLHVASHGMGGKALVTGGAALTAWLLKRVLVNPTTGRLALKAIEAGGNSVVYGAAIAELLRNTTKEPGAFEGADAEGAVTGTAPPAEAQPRAAKPAAAGGTDLTSPSRGALLNKPKGMVEQATLDINNRPMIQNEDGTHSSEYSFSREDNGKEVLVPSVVDGKFMTPDGKKPEEGSPEEKAMFDRAWEHYKQTGEHLGKFATPEDADAYAEKLHNRFEGFQGGRFGGAGASWPRKEDEAGAGTGAEEGTKLTKVKTPGTVTATPKPAAAPPKPAAATPKRNATIARYEAQQTAAAPALADVTGMGESEPAPEQEMVEKPNMDIARYRDLQNLAAPALADFTGMGEKKAAAKPAARAAAKPAAVVKTEKGKQVVVPTHVNGIVLTPEEAWAHYKQTGEHLGKFTDEEIAKAYAESFNSFGPRKGIGRSGGGGANF